MDNSTEILQLNTLKNGILEIKFNRPSALNALNSTFMQLLQDTLLAAKNNTAIKALLLTGEGKAFCAGADIQELTRLNGKDGLAFARRGQEIFNLLESLGKPSLAAINGFALGGGLELAMAATFRIAADTAIFGQPEIKLGVIPGFGGTQRLSRLIGKGRALDLCLTGRTINATDALSFGLVSEVVPKEELQSRAMATLENLIKLPPLALKSIITVINHGYDLTLTDALELEAAHFALCCATKDKVEGTQAFLEKRTAVFVGE
ncbi:MAG TPA: enoyl-CoA hydratase-related protein [Gammaproteobacteria bacterium]|jgi:enoyl-CoA hydratase|nr:enoyl-CoA hydratase-related protein [Gammaproteobacteria bacterium]